MMSVVTRVRLLEVRWLDSLHCGMCPECYGGLAYDTSLPGGSCGSHRRVRLGA